MGIFLGLFGADTIDLSDLTKITANSPDIIVYAVPAMVFFTLIEIFVAFKQKKDYYATKETWGSIMVGFGNLGVSALLKGILMLIIIAIYNLVPWRMELQWWTFIPCYIIYDFCSYWAHRVAHQQRFWWATHVAHHSGVKYNLSVSFRLSWVQHIKILFFLPAAFCGFHPIIFFITNQVAVLFQFWVHTEYIRKIHPIIEYIFATPSNHRVHHGTQPKYIDKNYAATFIVWDRWFGTYQPEEEQVVYGLTQNIKKPGNPFHINFHEYRDIFDDMRREKSLKRKFYMLFGPPAKIAQEKKIKTIQEEREKLQKTHKAKLDNAQTKQQETVKV